jgi:hypothetical protein
MSEAKDEGRTGAPVPPTRVAAARQRVSLTKRALAYGSAAAFVAALLLARAAHPGQPGASSLSPGVTTQTQETEQEDDFGFGTGSVMPSTGAPQVQSSVS